MDEATRRIVQDLDALRGADLHRVSDSELTQGLENLISVRRAGQLIHLDETQVWHRGRPCNGRKRFDHVSELIYPKVSNFKSRAGIRGTSVLYASRDAATVLSEVPVQSSELLQLVALSVKPGLVCESEIIGEFAHIQRSGSSLLGDDASIEFFTKKLNEDPAALLHAVLVDSFFGIEFSRKEKHGHEYRLTSAIASLVLNPPVEAILYPGVEHAGGLNIAVPSRVFDGKFEVLWSDQVRVEYIGYGQYTYTKVACSERIEPDGTIVWSPMLYPRQSLGEAWLLR